MSTNGVLKDLYDKSVSWIPNTDEILTFVKKKINQTPPGRHPGLELWKATAVLLRATGTVQMYSENQECGEREVNQEL